MKEIIAAVIGGILAAGTGWFLQWKAEKARLKNIKKLLTIGISDDLQHSATLYDRIEDDWNKTKTVWFATLIELRESRQTFINNRDYLLLFEDEHLRKDIFQYYLKSNEVISMLEWAQKRKYELNTKFQGLKKDIAFRQPQLQEPQINNLALTLMSDESQEFGNHDKTIQDQLHRLLDMKMKAQDLLKRLKD